MEALLKYTFRTAQVEVLPPRLRTFTYTPLGSTICTRGSLEWSPIHILAYPNIFTDPHRAGIGIGLHSRIKRTVFAVQVEGTPTIGQGEQVPNRLRWPRSRITFGLQPKTIGEIDAYGLDVAITHDGPTGGGIPGKVQPPSVNPAQPSMAVLLPFHTQAWVWREPNRCPNSW